MVQIKEGDTVANFILPRDGSGTIDTLKDINNLYIVYFYPKDDTPGCTIEAINFSESSSFFEDNNITIIGISKDSVEKHDKFKNKHNLKIILAADTDGKVCKSFGVWVQKSMYGRKYMGIERSTFIIDKDHIIRKVWRKVKVKDHVECVKEEIKGMINT